MKMKPPVRVTSYRPASIPREAAINSSLQRRSISAQCVQRGVTDQRQD
jgi:hypothetical protein